MSKHVFLIFFPSDWFWCRKCQNMREKKKIFNVALGNVPLLCLISDSPLSYLWSSLMRTTGRWLFDGGESLQAQIIKSLSVTSYKLGVGYEKETSTGWTWIMVVQSATRAGDETHIFIFIFFFFVPSCLLVRIQTNHSHGNQHTWSHDVFCSSAATVPLRAPSHSCKRWRGRRVTIHLIPSWMLFFSPPLGVILKRCSRLSPSKVPNTEAPGKYFIQTTPSFALCSHTESHVQTAARMKETSLSYISACNCRTHLESSRMMLFFSWTLNVKSRLADQDPTCLIVP